MLKSLRTPRAGRHAGCLLLLLVHWALAAPALATGSKPERLAVIAAAGSDWPGLDLPTLANIFRRSRVHGPDGSPIVPVNLPVADPVRRVFSATVFAMAPEAMQRYWNEQYYRGVSPPDVLASSTGVMRFVVATKGAMGYVPDCIVGTGLRVLLYLPVAPELRRELPDCPDP